MDAIREPYLQFRIHQVDSVVTGKAKNTFPEFVTLNAIRSTANLLSTSKLQKQLSVLSIRLQLWLVNKIFGT